MIRFLVVFLGLISSTLLLHGQDITVSVAGPATFDQHEEFNNDITVKNAGIVSVPAFETFVYLSDDNVWQSSDKWIGYISVNGLTAGQSVTKKAQFTEIQAEPGTRYIIIRADPNSSVVETDELNNELIIPIVVQSSNIDFVVNSFSLSKTSYKQNGLIEAAYEVSNSGTTNVGGFIYTSLYLSADENLSEDDIYIEKYSDDLTGTDLLQKTLDEFSYYFVPAVDPGNYYLIAKADELNHFGEVNEANNTSAKAITVAASQTDIRVEGYSFSTSGNNSVYGTLLITNIGSDPIGASYTQSIVNGSLTEMAYMPSPPSPGVGWYLLPGQSTSVPVNFYFFGVTPGVNYSLEVTANLNHLLAETDYSNNVYHQTISFGPPPVKAAAINSLSYSGLYDNTDRDLVLDVSLSNMGNVNYFYQYYTVEIRNASNTLVHTQNVSSYLPFSTNSITVPLSLSLTAPLAPGQYQTSIKCNPEGYDCFTTFNASTTTLNIDPVQYTLTGSVQGEDGVPINKGNLFLYQQTDNGAVKFIQKTTLASSAAFSFPVDFHKHTLYFIPDPEQYPQYVPTIYGKTLLLDGDSFFQLTENKQVSLEVIKIEPLAEGDGIISGTVTSGSESLSGRISSLSIGPVIPNAPVLLLSPAGKVNGFVYTNEQGYYEFKNLPRGDYQLLVPHELNIAGMDEPYPVSIAIKNAEVNFKQGTEAISIQEEVLLFDQSITMETISSPKFGQSPIILSAHSSSGLPVGFSISNPELAEVRNGELVLKGVGEFILTAEQGGNDFYKEAFAEQTITIGKGSQQIIFSELTTRTFGDAPFNLAASTSSELPLSWTSSDESIATVKNNQVVIRGAGKVELTALQSGNDLFESASVSQLLTIEKAEQFISFDELNTIEFPVEKILLEGSASSSLEVVFTTDNEETVSIQNGWAIIHKPGIVNITASQLGNENYKEAPSVTRQLVVNAVTGLNESVNAISVYPNPTSDFTYLDKIESFDQIEVIDMLGRNANEWNFTGNRIDFRGLASGTYILKLTSGNKVYSVRIVRR